MTSVGNLCGSSVRRCFSTVKWCRRRRCCGRRMGCRTRSSPCGLGWTRTRAAVPKSFTVSMDAAGSLSAGLDIHAAEGFANLAMDLTDGFLSFGEAAHERLRGVVLLFDEVPFSARTRLEPFSSRTGKLGSWNLMTPHSTDSGSAAIPSSVIFGCETPTPRADGTKVLLNQAPGADPPLRRYRCLLGDWVSCGVRKVLYGGDKGDVVTSSIVFADDERVGCRCDDRSMTGHQGVVAVVLAGILLAACSASGPDQTSAVTSGHTQATSPTPAAAERSIVALGDSVPFGTNCDCRPYPELTAADLAAAPERQVTASNDAVAGSTTGGVLRQITTDADVMARVQNADVVEIEVGANDVGYSDTCGTSLECYTPELPQLEKNLTDIVARVRELTPGRHVLVVLLDYWSVWLGGAYAAEKGEAYVRTVGELTDDVNKAITSVVAHSSTAYVDLRTAFKGPDYAYDETPYLSDDGDHPNAVGQRRIATAAVDVIESTLHS